MVHCLQEKHVLIGTVAPAARAGTLLASLLGKSASMPYVWLPRRAGLATLRRGDARGADPLPKHDWWNLPNSKG